MSVKAEQTAKLLSRHFEVGDKIKCLCLEVDGHTNCTSASADGRCHGVVIEPPEYAQPGEIWALWQHGGAAPMPPDELTLALGDE